MNRYYLRVAVLIAINFVTSCAVAQALRTSPPGESEKESAGVTIEEEIDPYSLLTPPAAPVQPAAPNGRYARDGFARAGHPEKQSLLARPSVTPGYSAGWVGGGAILRGEPRNIQTDGVWGYDYRGWLIPRRVWLGWTHGRRYQGGDGAYRTDGPPLKLSHYLESHAASREERLVK